MVVHLVLKVELGITPEPQASPIAGSGVIMKGGEEEAAAGTFQDKQSAESREQTAGGRKLKAGGRKIGRNDPCSCGSGKKYKRCCGR